MTILDRVQPGAPPVDAKAHDRVGAPFVFATTVQILGGVVVVAGSLHRHVLNVPLWIVLIAALFAAGVAVVAMGRRRRRSVGTRS